jgi:hypothetical protein
MRIFIFCIFTAVKHSFRIFTAVKHIFTGVLSDSFLLNSANNCPICKIKGESLSNCDVKNEKNVYNKQKIQVLSINTGFIFIL